MHSLISNLNLLLLSFLFIKVVALVFLLKLDNFNIVNYDDILIMD